MRVWMVQGSLSGGRLDPVGEKIALDLTATRRRAERAQRTRRARREEILKRVRLGAEADDSGRWQALCLLDVARPEVRRGAQLWVMVWWQGVDTAGWGKHVFVHILLQIKVVRAVSLCTNLHAN